MLLALENFRIAYSDTLADPISLQPQCLANVGHRLIALYTYLASTVYVNRRGRVRRFIVAHSRLGLLILIILVCFVFRLWLFDGAFKYTCSFQMVRIALLNVGKPVLHD